MQSYTEQDANFQPVQAKVVKICSVERQRLFGCCMQLRYIFTLDAASSARRYHRRADETNACSRIKESCGSLHGGGDGFCVSNRKFASWLGRQCTICRSFGVLEWYRLRANEIVATFRVVQRCCWKCQKRPTFLFWHGVFGFEPAGLIGPFSAFLRRVGRAGVGKCTCYGRFGL